MKNKKAYFVAVVALMFATIVVAMMLDKTFSFALPISTAAVTLLMTFSLCFLFNDWFLGLLAGVLFGLASWLKAVAFGEPFTINPLVSLLPRIFVGIVAFAVYSLVLKFFYNKCNKTAQIVSMSIGALLGLIVNTLLFLTALNIYKDYLGADYSSLAVIIKTVMFTNILPEYVISIVAVPIIVLSVRKGLKLGIDGNNLKKSEFER